MKSNFEHLKVVTYKWSTPLVFLMKKFHIEQPPSIMYHDYEKKSGKIKEKLGNFERKLSSKHDSPSINIAKTWNLILWK